ncbi:MAG: cell division protein ZapE [Pseudomonadota bacterium]|nr:cell division protein ZapE [Pseudomonadota bacterium]
MKSLETWYHAQTQNKNLEFDSIQLDILQQLDTFIDKFKHRSQLTNLFERLSNKPKQMGYYIYGLVGRGKSMIMNEVFRIFPEPLKQRIHFHEFMYNIQQQLATLKAHEEPLKIVAKQIRQKIKIIFLDEMIVNDIASAMILKNLFNSLFAENVYIITTSNDKPDNLYIDGLMRDRFLPAIELINNKLIVLCLDGVNDYRLLHDSTNQLFIINATNYPENNSFDTLNMLFNNINQNQPVENNSIITIQARQIPFIKKSHGIIWFDFNIICGDKRSQLDYLELIKQFEWFIISNIYALDDQSKDIARRLTWLIDILYDNQCKLALSSHVDISQIYASGDLMHEFARTKSRLMEMQTKEYLAKPTLSTVVTPTNFNKKSATRW